MRKTASIVAAVLLLGLTGCASQEVKEEAASQPTTEVVEAAEVEQEIAPEPKEVEIETLIPLSEGRTVRQLLEERTASADVDPAMIDDPELSKGAARLMAISWMEQALSDGMSEQQLEAETRAALSYVTDWESITVAEATGRATDACKVIEKYGPDGLRSVYEEHPEDGEFVLVISAATHCQQFLKEIE